MVESDRGGGLVFGVWCLEESENQRIERVRVSRPMFEGKQGEDEHP
jgi:hypothetical protein